MSNRTLSWMVAPALFAGLVLAPASETTAQESADEDPGRRIVAMTMFDVPYGPERATVVRYMREHYLPFIQLNPRVLNFRLLTHYYGSHGARVVVMREVEEWADIEAPCGDPCTEYRQKHPLPEEGTPEREAYEEARALFQKFYANHRDEVYSALMDGAVVEASVVGRVGPAEEEEAQVAGEASPDGR